MNTPPTKPTWLTTLYRAALRHWYNMRSARYFNQRFRVEDPWAIDSSEHEGDRLLAVMDALKGRTFDRALEVGCAEGQLTVRLAGIARALTALDISATAVARAKIRCAAFPNVAVECGSICDHPIDSHYDLITATEVLYYLLHRHTAELLRLTCQRLSSVLAPNGILLTTNYFDKGDHRSVAAEETIRRTLRESGLTELSHEVRAGTKSGQTRTYVLALFTR